MSTKKDHINFIETQLIPTIFKKDETLLQQRLIDFKIVDNGKSLDGFMSALYQVEIRASNETTEGSEHLHQIMVKFMKGDKSFRESSKSYTQFANEIFIYSKVIPYYKEIIEKSGSSINVNNWVPHVYFSKYGLIDGLSSGAASTVVPEAVLALENLCPRGFRCGPREFLDREHLLLMTKPLAEYHALTYALRIQKDPRLQSLINEIIPLPFQANKNDGQTTNLYEVLYRLAFDRFFEYSERVKESIVDSDKDDVLANVNNLKRNYFDKPTLLLDRFREIDETFAVILHGDYNRNNVLFQYDKDDGFDEPKDIRMIDFQELRYGTPSIDLSFFMYMAIEPSMLPEIWMELLESYHGRLIETLIEILHVDRDDDKLKPYSFEKFYQHFSRFAFYGAMVTMHFAPFMSSSEDECSQLANFFETDMHGDEFREISIKAGGDKVNKRILDAVCHASRMGYMDICKDDDK